MTVTRIRTVFACDPERKEDLTGFANVQREESTKQVSDSYLLANHIFSGRPHERCLVVCSQICSIVFPFLA